MKTLKLTKEEKNEIKGHIFNIEKAQILMETGAELERTSTKEIGKFLKQKVVRLHRWRINHTTMNVEYLENDNKDQN